MWSLRSSNFHNIFITTKSATPTSLITAPAVDALNSNRNQYTWCWNTLGALEYTWCWSTLGPTKVYSFFWGTDVTFCLLDPLPVCTLILKRSMHLPDISNSNHWHNNQTLKGAVVINHCQNETEVKLQMGIDFNISLTQQVRKITLSGLVSTM